MKLYKVYLPASIWDDYDLLAIFKNKIDAENYINNGRELGILERIVECDLLDDIANIIWN